MTDEASTMVVVARAALEGALRAALPHVARRIPEDAPDNGAGLMRLAVVQDCVMVLAVAIDRKRAIAVRFTVLDGDSYGDGVKSMWLRRSAVEALATFLAGSPVERVSLLLDEREGITVQETGVLYGPQMARVAPAAEPMDEDRVDAARLLLDGAHGVLYQDAAVEMDPAVVRTFAASAAAWQIPLRVRDGDGYGRSSFIWGTDACLGWSAGSVLLQVSSCTTGRRSRTWRRRCFRLCSWGALACQRGCESTKVGRTREQRQHRVQCSRRRCVCPGRRKARAGLRGGVLGPRRGEHRPGGRQGQERVAV